MKKCIIVFLFLSLFAFFGCKASDSEDTPAGYVGTSLSVSNGTLYTRTDSGITSTFSVWSNSTAYTLKAVFQHDTTTALTTTTATISGNTFSLAIGTPTSSQLTDGKTFLTSMLTETGLTVTLRETVSGTKIGVLRLGLLDSSGTVAYEMEKYYRVGSTSGSTNTWTKTSSLYIYADQDDTITGTVTGTWSEDGVPSTENTTINLELKAGWNRIIETSTGTSTSGVSANSFTTTLATGSEPTTLYWVAASKV